MIMSSTKLMTLQLINNPPTPPTSTATIWKALNKQLIPPQTTTYTSFMYKTLLGVTYAYSLHKRISKQR